MVRDSPPVFRYGRRPARCLTLAGLLDPLLLLITFVCHLAHLRGEHHVRGDGRVGRQRLLHVRIELGRSDATPRLDGLPGARRVRAEGRRFKLGGALLGMAAMMRAFPRWRWWARRSRRSTGWAAWYGASAACRAGGKSCVSSVRSCRSRPARWWSRCHGRDLVRDVFARRVARLDSQGEHAGRQPAREPREPARAGRGLRGIQALLHERKPVFLAGVAAFVRWCSPRRAGDRCTRRRCSGCRWCRCCSTRRTTTATWCSSTRCWCRARRRGGSRHAPRRRAVGAAPRDVRGAVRHGAGQTWACISTWRQRCFSSRSRCCLVMLLVPGGDPLATAGVSRVCQKQRPALARGFRWRASPISRRCTDSSRSPGGS